VQLDVEYSTKLSRQFISRIRSFLMKGS